MTEKNKLAVEIQYLQKLSRELDIDSFVNIGKKYGVLFMGYTFTSTEFSNYLLSKNVSFNSEELFENLIDICQQLNIKYEPLNSLSTDDVKKVNEAMIHLR